MRKILVFSLVFISQTSMLFSQTTSISGVINTYTAATTIPVCNPCSSTCNYLDVVSIAGFAIGDKVLVIQMKGATTDLSNTAAFGSIQSYGNAGLYEFKTIASVSGTRLTFTSTLYNTYDVPGLVQVVRVPQYVNATVTATLTAQPWNGTTGGILVFDVLGTLTLNADITVVAMGFRGGIGASNGTTYPYDQADYFYAGPIYEPAAPKGEGIATILPGYELGKGAYANAGGGGNAHNAGGGGGSNAGAGGFGGNQYNTFTGSVSNGIGGYAIPYSGGDRLYMGGGGGAGHQNDNFGTNGGNGGGMVFINATTVVGNSHKIIASGDSSLSTIGGGNDGAGGAGGAGVIKINATSFTGTISLIAVGGKGGDNTYSGVDEHAPGGGGGGGLICLASATIPAGVTTNVSGGAPGLYRLNGDNFGTTPGKVGNVLNACNFIIPAGPKELKPNLGSDIQLCNPIVANLDARLIGSWYTYTWYKDNLLISGVTSQTYSTNEVGRFKVVVSSTGCLPGVDSVDITTNAATAINATFCAPPASAVLLKVTGSGEYKWWDEATSGNAVGKGITYTTPAILTTNTYYVEDTSTISGSVGPTVLNTTGLSGYNGSQLGFTLSQDIEITSLRVPFITNYSPAGGYPGFTITLEIVDQNGNSFSPAQTFTSNTSLESVPGNNGGNTDLYTFTFTNFVIPVSLGRNLRLKFISSTNTSGAPSFNQGATFSYPYNSSIPGVVTITGSSTNGGAMNTSDYAFFYDWQIKARTNLCLRVPVTATLSCPPPSCSKPTSVSVQLGTGINDTLCIGNALVIQKNAIDTSTVSSLNGFYFSWRKINASVNTIVQGPSKTYSDLSISSVTITDSGSYYLVVQDGLVASPMCKDSAFVMIKINQAPITKALIEKHQEICLGDATTILTEVSSPVNYVGTPLYYQWYKTSDTTGTPTLTKIAALSTSVTYNPGSPIITQYYVRKDSVKYCPAVVTNFLKIRVNNSIVTDTILPLENDTLCVSAGSHFQLKGVVDSTGKASINKGYYFTWMQLQQPATVPVVVGTPGVYADYPPASRFAVEADSGTYYLIIQDGAGATVCKDTLKTKVVVIPTCTIIIPTCKKPVLVSTTLIGNDTLCVGNGFAIQKNVVDISAGPPLSAYYYSWRKINSAGSVLLAPPSLTYSDLILTNIIPADSGRYYLIVQDGIANDPTCKDSSTAISIVVHAPITAAVIAPSQTICQGTTPGLLAEPTPSGVLSQYQWYISTDSFKTVPASQLLVGAIADSYQPAVLSATSYFIRRDSVGACPAVNSNIITIQVDQLLIPGVVGNDTLICSGSPIPTFKEITAASGGTGVFTYQWQSSGDNYTFSSIPGETNNTYQSPVLVNNNYFRRIDSSGVCGKLTGTISIVVKFPISAPAVIGASDTICQGSAPNMFTETSASGVPDYYQWYVSTDSFKTVAASQEIPGAIANSYQSTALSNTSYFIRKDSVGSCPTLSSNIITIAIDKPIIPGVVGNDTVVCIGSPIRMFKELGTVGGGIGVFTYQWQLSSDDVTFSDIAGATQNTYQSPNTNNKTYFRRTVHSGVCAQAITDTILVNVLSGVHAGTVSNNSPTICYNTIPTASFISVTGASNGTGGVGSEIYQWQQSIDDVTWTDIATETGLSFTETNALIDTVYYRRRVIMGSGSCDTSYTAVTAINVYAPFVAGSIGIDSTVCEGVSIILNEKTVASGGGIADAETYKWIASTDKGQSWITATGISNQKSFTTPLLTDSIRYRRVVSTQCKSDTSNGMQINVNLIASVSVAITDAVTCASTDVAFTSTSTGAGSSPIYTWYSGTSAAGPWTLIIGEIQSSYTVLNPVAADDGRYYRVVLKSSERCNTGDGESIAKLRVKDGVAPSVTIRTEYNPICAGYPINFVATATDAGTSPTYQWYIVPIGSGTPNQVGTNDASYTSTPLVTGDQVYVEVTSSLSCALLPNPATSNKITMTVFPVPTPNIVEPNDTLCFPGTPSNTTFTANVSSGNTVHWYYNGSPIIGATNLTYKASNAGTYSVQESNAACNAISPSRTLTLIPTPIANAGPDVSLPEGAISALGGSGGAIYSWSPATYLSTATLSNPTYKATQTIAYELTVSDATGKCKSKDDVIVYVVKPIIVPNVITVNGDGTNDTWEIENMHMYPNSITEIYNRWGNLVWKAEGYPKNWDGTNFRNGEVLPDGTYFYIINLHSDVYPDPHTGWIQIIK